MKKCIGILIFTLFISSFSFAQYTFQKEFSARAHGYPIYNSLKGVKVDSTGKIYAADFGMKSIIITDSTGLFLEEILLGKNVIPFDVALDDSLNIYVAVNVGVIKINSDRELQLILSLKDVEAVCVDHNYDFYIRVWGEYHLRKYNRNSILIKEIGGLGVLNGLFDYPPRTIAIDEKSNIYVTTTNSIHSFDSTGNFIKKFGTLGTLDGQFNGAYGIAYNKNNGNIAVCEMNNHRIQIFDTSGTFIRRFGNYGLEEGEFREPLGLCFDVYNNLIVVDNKNIQYYVRTIQKFDFEGQYIQSFGMTGYEDSLLYLPNDVKIDSKGNIYVSSESGRGVMKFDSTWKFITKIGYSNLEGVDSSFKGILRIRLDHHDNLYVCDRFAYNVERIQKFTEDSKFVSSWIRTNEDTIFINPHENELAYDSYGNSYTSNYFSVVVEKPPGVIKSVIGEGGQANGEFKGSKGLCFDKNGLLYVTDVYNARVQIFEPCPQIRVKEDIGISINHNAYSYNFGSCAPEDTLYKMFIIENIGTVPLTISSIHSSNIAFNIVLGNDMVLNPDESTSLMVKFSPIVLGNHVDTIFISTNDVSTPKFLFEIKGTTKAVLAVSVEGSYVDYGHGLFYNITVSEPVETKTIVIENLGYESLEIDSIVNLLPHNYFDVNLTNMANTIAGFDQTTFDIIFSHPFPQNQPPYSGKGTLIVIYSNDEKQPVFLITCIGSVVTDLLEIEEFLKEINLFPNPASHYVNIHSQYRLEHVKVLDAIGNEVMQENLNGNTKLDISRLSKGLYHFIIQTEQGTVTKKVSVW